MKKEDIIKIPLELTGLKNSFLEKESAYSEKNEISIKIKTSIFLKSFFYCFDFREKITLSSIEEAEKLTPQFFVNQIITEQEEFFDSKAYDLFLEAIKNKQNYYYPLSFPTEYILTGKLCVFLKAFSVLKEVCEKYKLYQLWFETLDLFKQVDEIKENLSLVNSFLNFDFFDFYNDKKFEIDLKSFFDLFNNDYFNKTFKITGFINLLENILNKNNILNETLKFEINLNVFDYDNWKIFRSNLIKGYLAGKDNILLNFIESEIVLNKKNNLPDIRENLFLFKSWFIEKSNEFNFSKNLFFTVGNCFNHSFSYDNFLNDWKEKCSKLTCKHKNLDILLNQLLNFGFLNNYYEIEENFKFIRI